MSIRGVCTVCKTERTLTQSSPTASPDYVQAFCENERTGTLWRVRASGGVGLAADYWEAHSGPLRPPGGLPPLIAEPRARAGDPDTSWEAARSVQDLTHTRLAIIEVLDRKGALTDPGIWEALDPRDRTSPSGIRTRRAELVALGLVRDSGFRVAGVTGRRMIVWERVPPPPDPHPP